MGCGGSTEQAESPANSSPTAGKSVTRYASSALSAQVIESLKSRFNEISKLSQDDGLIDETEFNQILKLEKSSLFTERLFQIFDCDRSGSITLDEFIQAMAILSPDGPVIDKIGLSFKMWDFGHNDLIDKKELVDFTKASLAQSPILMDAKQMESLINATFALTDQNCDQEITFAEYKKLVERFPNMLNYMTLDVEKKMGLKPVGV